MSRTHQFANHRRHSGDSFPAASRLSPGFGAATLNVLARFRWKEMALGAFGMALFVAGLAYMFAVVIGDERYWR